MAAPTIYRSTDSGAPTLNGNAGSLVTLLDACLVNGYGSKAAAGWAKPFSATNKAVYRAPAGARMYLDVDDSGPNATALGREAQVKGYETMTAVATGTNPFPSVAQNSIGVVVRKSATNDSTARAWIVLADDKTMILFLASGDTAGRYAPFYFGDIYSFTTGDAYRSLIMGGIFANTAANGQSFDSLSVSSTSATSGHYYARVAAGTGTSLNGGKMGVGTNLSPSGSTGPVPMANGAVMLCPLFACGDSGVGIRGYLRGLYQSLHAFASHNDGDTFDGSGAYAGRSFMVVKQITTITLIVVETTEWAASS